MSDFLEILIRSSITADIAAVIVIILRAALRKCPRKWSYFLWAAVFFRCIFPFSFESSISVFNLFSAAENFLNRNEYAITEESGQITDVNIKSDNYAEISDTVFTFDDTAENTETINNFPQITETAVASTEKHNRADILFVFWITGAAAMLIYGAASYFLLMRKVRTAIKTEKNIFESDRINSAFSAISFPPKIYVPAGLEGEEKRLIIAHEQAHIKRFDPFAKLLAYIGMSLHWFDPIIWLSFILMTRDMEISCDESILSGLDINGRKNYSMALLNASVKQSGIFFPPAFAEKIISARIQNAISYKKPLPAVSVLSAAAVLITSGTLITDAAASRTEAESAVTVMISVTSAEGDIPNGLSLLTDSDGDKIYFSCGNNFRVNNIFKCVNGAEIEFKTPYFGDKNNSGFSAGNFNDGNITLFSDEEFIYDVNYIESIIINDIDVKTKNDKKYIGMDMTFAFPAEYKRYDHNIDIHNEDENSSYTIHRESDTESSVKAEFIIPDTENIPAVTLFGYAGIPIFSGENINCIPKSENAAFQRYFDLNNAEKSDRSYKSITPYFIESPAEGIRIYTFTCDDNTRMIFEHDGTADVFINNQLTPQMIPPEIYYSDLDNDGENELAVKTNSTGTGISIDKLVIYKKQSDGHFSEFSPDMDKTEKLMKSTIKEFNVDYNKKQLHYRFEPDKNEIILVTGNISDNMDFFKHFYPNGVYAEDLDLGSQSHFIIDGNKISYSCYPGLMTIYYFANITADVTFKDGEFYFENFNISLPDNNISVEMTAVSVSEEEIAETSYNTALYKYNEILISERK